MTSRFTPAAQSALNQAQNEASEMGHTYIGTEHLLLGLLCQDSSVAAELLKGKGIEYAKTRKLVISLCGSGSRTDPPPTAMTPRLKEVLKRAAEAMPGAFGRIGTEQLLFSLLNEEECFASRIIEKQNVLCRDLSSDLFSLKPTKSKPKTRKKLPPMLSKYGRLLSETICDPVIGREPEIEALIEVLCRRRKNNPCLIGEPGVGKTAVVEGLAERINDGNVPSFLRDKAIVSLDIAAMLAGAKYRGEFEERLKTVLAEASDDPDIILFIDELHTIVGTGGSEGSIDAANILKPALARGDIKLIGATTVSEYRRHIESDSALERRFLPISVEEPTKDQTKEILLGLKEKYEAHHGISITDEAIDACIELSIRYLPSKKLPDKAIDILDEAAAAKRIELEKAADSESALSGIIKGLEIKKEEAVEGDTDLIRALEESLNARLSTLNEKKDLSPLKAVDIESVLKKRQGHLCLPTPYQLGDLEERLGSAIFGQEEAIAKISAAVRAGTLGINGSERPIASLLLLGPSGVGKTAACSALAECLYGNAQTLIRFDMSEYSEKHSVSKLIGSPPGYVGYRDEGLLIKEVRSKPYSVVLFDEAEKAHPDIFGLLLQILDRGSLSDAQGRQADFRGCTVILTSNLGNDGQKKAGFSLNTTKDGAADAAKTFFRPELLGRMDAVIQFSPITKDAALEIAKNGLSALSKRLSQCGIRLKIDDVVLDAAANAALTSPFGARAIFSFIKSEIESRIILRISDKDAQNGISVISMENGKISIKTVTNPEFSHTM